MPRPPRADEANGLYHALNRGNLRATIFHKDNDYIAFEQILAEGLERYRIELFSYQLMPNHFHLVLRPLVDGEMGRFMKWIGGTHTMRYHAHYQTGGLGHVYQQRFKSFPIQDDPHFLTVCRYVERNALRAGLVHRAEDWTWGSLWRWLQKSEPVPKLLSAWPLARLSNWADRVNEPLTDKELDLVRRCAHRGQPFGDEAWTESCARRLNLESTMRARGRPRRVVPEITTETGKET
jgi:putative transposase